VSARQRLSWTCRSDPLSRRLISSLRRDEAADGRDRAKRNLNEQCYAAPRQGPSQFRISRPRGLLVNWMSVTNRAPPRRRSSTTLRSSLSRQRNAYASPSCCQSATRTVRLGGHVQSGTRWVAQKIRGNHSHRKQNPHQRASYWLVFPAINVWSINRAMWPSGI